MYCVERIVNGKLTELVLDDQRTWAEWTGVYYSFRKNQISKLGVIPCE